MPEYYLEYKGYYTKIKIDFKERSLYGKIEDITDYVDFESDTVKGIINEFHNAVDDYLEFCQEVGKSPAEPIQNFQAVSMA